METNEQKKQLNENIEHQVSYKAKTKTSKIFRIVLNLLLAVVFLLMVGNIAFEWVYDYSYVIGASMQNTYNENYLEDDNTTYDTVIYADNKEIVVGDVIIAMSPNEPNKFVIKRVIALSGDKIEIKKEYNATTLNYEYYVYLNNQKLNEDYLKNKNDVLVTYNNFYYGLDCLRLTYSEYFDGNTLTVPENYVFYMGDNRGNSQDCSNNGPQSMDKVIGKVEYVHKAGEQLDKVKWFFVKCFGGYKYLFNKIF